ncbi:MAG: ABC transporter substrate-binding protein [Propionibacteriaceae bacterium]|nr:ABC transporter substrate-binding protein [Propionibacteriaceae bacterium]
MRRQALPALLLTALLGAALTGCAADSSDQSTISADGRYVNGAVFRLGLATDPGGLDPHASGSSAVFQLSALAYDSLVAINAAGQIEPQLAQSWQVDGDSVTLSLRSGVTCSDGSAFKASTAVQNIDFIEDPANLSPYLGSFLPAGLTATADDAAGTVTLQLSQPSPFLLQGLSQVPMVCQAGLDDRASLTAGTIGSGPFRLREAVPNDRYVYDLNRDYAWGPNGLTGQADGLPISVEIRIITNETTAANLLLAGELDATLVMGPDGARLTAAGVGSKTMPGLWGEQWYNQNPGHPTADRLVRQGLTQAVDWSEAQRVLTSDTGSDATQLTVLPPAACTYDALTGYLPQHDPAAAAASLDAAGWLAGPDGRRAKDGQPLVLTFLYDAALGSGGAAAAELVAQQWIALGVGVESTQLDNTLMLDALFGTGAWDIAWEPLNVSNPDQVVGFLSGPGAPEGTNFAGIDNSAYDEAVARAMTMNGSESCSAWAEGETALMTDAAVVPFANSIVHMFVRGVDFSFLGLIQPATIRMLAG